MGTQQITEVRVEDLHPHEKNPRIDAAQVADLVESIRTYGVEVPLVVAPRAVGGGYVVLAGHRRLTALMAAGLTSAPVQIRKDLTAAFDQLAFMATENLHRDQLTAMEEARLFQDMLDLGGWTQADIAAATAVKKTRVSERLKLGRLGEATGEKVHRGQISIEEALAIAEYSSDPDAVASLEAAVGTPNFDWQLSRVKAHRQAERARVKVAKEIRATGGRIADPEAAFMDLRELVDEDMFTTERLTDPAVEELRGDEWDAVAAAEHEACPGHCALATPEGPVWGCDRVATEHARPSQAADRAPEAKLEPAPNPWAEFSNEDFTAARIHREEALAAALPHADPRAEATAWLVSQVIKMGWPGYWDDEPGIALLEAITGAKGKTKVSRELAKWPLTVLAYLAAHAYGIKAQHRYMAEGKQGSSYWGPSSDIRQLLNLIGYKPSPVEQRACELATGQPWTATPVDAPAAADAEAGGQA